MYRSNYILKTSDHPTGTVRDSALISEYLFSGNLNDTKNGNNLTGVDNSYTTNRKGESNKAASFDGSLSYAYAASVVVPIGAKSISFWMKANTATKDESLIDNNGFGTINDGISINSLSGGSNIRVILTDGTAIFNIQSGNVRDGYWHHIAFTWDGTTDSDKVKLYVDGVLYATATAARTETNTPTYDLYVSNRANYLTEYDTSFLGKIDDIRIFDRELTYSEVLSETETNI